MTTIPVSVVPQVVAYLKTAIQTQLATTSTATLRNATYVFAGDPTTPNLPDDFICVGAISRTVTRMAFVGSGGRGALEEKFDVTVTVSSWRGGNTEEFVSNRAWTLIGFVEAAVRADPSLGGLVLQAFPSRSTSQGPVFTATPVGPQVTVKETIHVDNPS